MNLILLVKSYRDQPMPGDVICRFTEVGGSIGRGPDNDLTLDDPGKYISRVHARIELDEDRLRALAPDLDIESVNRHLQAITAICRGGPGTGPIGLLPARARFHWLTAKRSSILQTSPVHTGKCGDMDAIMEHLLQRMVRKP